MRNFQTTLESIRLKYIFVFASCAGIHVGVWRWGVDAPCIDGGTLELRTYIATVHLLGISQFRVRNVLFIDHMLLPFALVVVASSYGNILPVAVTFPWTIRQSEC